MYLKEFDMGHLFQTAVLLGAATACFASFTWGIKGHFRSTGKIPPGMKLVSLLSLFGFISFIGQLINSEIMGSTPVALGLFTASLALFGATIHATRQTPPTLAFDTDKPEFLMQHGPYKYVRHPFYVSYMLFWVGTAVTIGNIFAWLTPVIMLVVYQQAASREESKFANSELSAAYKQYQRRAGMFVPSVLAIIHD